MVNLSPAKLVLLAAHYAVEANIPGLTVLATRHGNVLRSDLLLRILLTYLPETLPSSKYVDLIRQIETRSFPDLSDDVVDPSPVEGFTEQEAKKRVRKLKLLPLTAPEGLEEAGLDCMTLFLLRRAIKVDEETGMLPELPALLLPFVDHAPCIRTLLVSSILPLIRRNCEYYPQDTIPYTLQVFRGLPDEVAASLLLSQTGVREGDLHLVGRDLRGLISPWLFDERRWRKAGSNQESTELCPGWGEVLHWLTIQASKDWKVAVSAFQRWDGPRDADLAGWGSPQLTDDQRAYLEEGYARAALASAYLIPEATLEALDGAYILLSRAATLHNLEPVPPLSSAVSLLPPLTEQIPNELMSARNLLYSRNDLLSTSNPLTAPTDGSVALLQALVLSAHLLSKAGCPCTVRRAAELALLQDEREQKKGVLSLIRAISMNGPKSDDRYWIKARNEMLWLRDWGAEDGWGAAETAPRGVFGQVKKEFLEVEFLKALLASTRYNLACNIYEESPDRPLDEKTLHDTIYATAMAAYDNSSNPNRHRGGLKKCDEIIKSFPKTFPPSSLSAKKVEALLQATHSLSDYRLVLKQGEPFTPVVLRVHTDPIFIIAKILEQNPKSYTQLHTLLDLGNRMVEAGLTAPKTPSPSQPIPDEASQRALTERRIISLCIDAALSEDDFETAYSYVINRLSTPPLVQIEDNYSWKAALEAGKYRRTSRTTLPTHLGMSSSANVAVRHLEQRIDCLATALRIAPAATLQEILSAFRLAEEELDALVKEEQAKEEEWDAKGDAFRSRSATKYKPPPSASSTRSAQLSNTARHRSTDDDDSTAPMSLFDLSRASMLSAQRNLSALSGLQRAATSLAGTLTSSGRNSPAPARDTDSPRGSLDVGAAMQKQMSNASATSGGSESGGGQQQKRVRKRDQLREAAVGTLVSGVGWLVGATPPPREQRDW